MRTLSALGFVMGHNMLDAYWDDSEHNRVKKPASLGRNGMTPRQDMSGIVTGSVVEYLNENFYRAWLRSANVGLFTPRKPIEARRAVNPAKGAAVMAQITRMQSQKSRQDIRALYMQAAKKQL